MREVSSSSLSASFTDVCCLGLSLNQNQKMMHHTRPRPAKATNEYLQPISPIAASTSGGVKAPPQRANAQSNPLALTRPRAESHMLSMRVRIGKHPASPAPKRKRITQREMKLQAAPVTAVKNDQP